MRKALLLLILFFIGGLYGHSLTNRPAGGQIYKANEVRLLPLPEQTQAQKVEALEKALKDTPLASQAAMFVAVANRYDMDYRLLPAISFAESSLCKYFIDGTHNCWGWLSGRQRFGDFEEAIETIARKLHTLPAYQNWREDKENLAALAATYNVVNQKAWLVAISQFLERIEEEEM